MIYLSVKYLRNVIIFQNFEDLSKNFLNTNDVTSKQFLSSHVTQNKVNIHEILPKYFFYY